jgi:AcrR family transcriptional regulator
MGETNMARKRLTRAESKARTRAYLLEAAAALFRRHGFEGTSVEQIAEEAGYTKGALYTHFASKEDLFAALLESTVRTQIEDLRDRIAAEERPEARYDLLRRMSARWGGDQDAAMLDAELRLAAARNPALGVKLAPLADQLYATLAGLIARVAGDAGVVLPLPARDLAPLLHIAATGVALQRAVTPLSVADDLALSTFALLLPLPAQQRDGGGGGQTP